MKASLNELRKYVDLTNLTSKEIAEKLTFSGIEVEEVKSLAFATNLVIGKIISCVNHPDSDHLHILNVDEGSELGIHQIVCGAPNARKDLKVIVALEGCKLNGGTITKSTIRGVESDGMCCSLVELGLDPKTLPESETKGIHELDENAPIGERNVLGYLGLDDEILDLKVLANRPDLLSIYNIARELGGLFNRKVNIPSYSLDIKDSPYKAKSDTPLCESFYLSYVKGCKNTSSPRWLKTVLTNMGVRSINAIVDIGNYVMLLTGQPLNMYDAKALKEKELVVTTSYFNKWLALDEKEYDLKEGDIVIKSGEDALCLAGLMTSKEASVSLDTNEVLIESASFNGTSIRHTSNRLGLSSESSTRFVKGINKFQSEEVLAFAIDLIVSICGGSYVGTSFTSSIKYEEQHISFSYDKINARLATSFSKEEIDYVLKAFNFDVKDGYVIVPKYRLDLTSDADLSEEVIRYYGSDKVDVKLPKVDLTVGKLTPKCEKENLISSFLLARGFDQCLTYTLTKKDNVTRYPYLALLNPVKIMNPLTDEHEYMRTSLVLSLLEVANYNVSRKQNDLSLFEISDIYAENHISTRLAIVLTGNKDVQGKLKQYKNNFFSIKGILEEILAMFGIDSNRYKIERLLSDRKEFHPYQSATIKFNNYVVGVFGELHPNEKKRLGLDNLNCEALELNLTELFNLKTGKIKISQISKFPSVSRDLAFVIKNDVSCLDIISEIKKAGKGFIKEVNVFDIYEGDKVAPNMKSIAFNITYELSDRTLTDNDIVSVENKIKEALLKKYNATLRA